MSWISLVIIAFVSYNPIYNANSYLKMDSLRFFLYSVGAWFLLASIFLLIESASHLDLLSKTRLRNGMLYSTRPIISNNLALALSAIILTYSLLKLISKLLDARLLALFPYDLDNLVFPSALILLASLGFLVERRYRYLADVRRHQADRKRTQKKVGKP